MSIPGLERAIEELKRLCPRQWKSETARLGVVIGDVERVISDGVLVTAVHSELRDAGLELTLEGFQSARKRLRNRAAAAGKKTAGNEPSKKATNGGNGGSARLRGAVQRPPRFEHNPDADAIDELLKYDNGDE